MSELETFEPGTEIQRIDNPTCTGVVLNVPPRRIGKKIKQTVRWTNGTVDEVNIATIESLQQQQRSSLDLIASQTFGKRLALNDSLVHFRLSGSLQDIIYSMNLTNTEFFPYQFKPLLTFFNSFNNCLLIADEVGLGKTIEAGLIWTELTIREQAQRLLVICPAQLCEKWKFELQSKFGISSEIVNAKTLLENIKNICAGSRRSGVFIVSYEQVRPPKQHKNKDTDNAEKGSRAQLAKYLEDLEFRDDVFNMLIVDEAHRVRNEQSQQHRGVNALRNISENTLFLSATPIQTSDQNLFALLKILDPSTYPFPEAMDRIIRMNEPLVTLETKIANEEITAEELIRELNWGRTRRNIYGADLSGIDELLSEGITDEQLKNKKFRVELIKRIGQLNPLNRIMTRTLKRDVQERRVVREPFVRLIELNPKEQKYYEEVTAAVQRYCENSDLPVGFILTFSQQMMSSSLPASLNYWCDKDAETALNDFESVVEDGSIDTDEGGTKEVGPILSRLRMIARNFIRSEGEFTEDSKLEELIKVIREQLSADGSKKILVFSFYKATLRYLSKELSARGIRCGRVDGSLERSDRQILVEQFKDGKFDVLLCSEVMAEGVDLQFVDCLVNYDLPWNPARIEQRIGRIDRIGQKSPVITIFNFVYKDTIESRIYSRLLDRLNVFRRALGVSEEVLGQEIDKLTKTLFSKQLTPAQQEQQLEQSLMAIERSRQQGEEAKGNSVVYKLMDETVEDTRRLQRYVTGNDLKSYVESFCRRDKGGSRLIHKHDDVYGLELSSIARVRLEDFLSIQGRSLETTDILTNPDLELRFMNKTGSEPRGIERITQSHPLIRFISCWNDQEDAIQKQTAAVILPAASEPAGTYDSIPYGVYAYSCQLWSVQLKSSFRRRAKLGYSAINIRTGQPLGDEQAEILVTHAARYGRDMSNYRDLPDTEKLLEAVSDAEDELDNEYLDYRREVLLSAREEALMIKSISTSKLEQLTDNYEKQKEKLKTEAEAGVSGVKGRRVALDKKFEKKKKDYEDRITSAELAMEELKSNPIKFSSGIIEFKETL